MSKLDKKVAHKANIPLSSHDLSHTLDYTSAIGMLLPVCHDILNPGEKISINVDLSQTRTMPLQSAAFCDIDLHMDYFFVPMSLIYSPFESFIYQINDNFSSVFDNAGDYASLPLLDLGALATLIDTNKAAYFTGSIPYSGFFDCVGKGAFRLLDMLGMNPFFGTMAMSLPSEPTVSPTNYHPSVFPYQLLAYQAIYQQYFRLDDYEQFYNGAFNIDGKYGSSIDPALMYCHLHYRPYYMDYFNSVKNSPIVTGTNLANSPALPLAKSWLSRDNVDVNQLNTGDGNVLYSGYTGSSSPVNGSPDSLNPSAVRTQFGFAVNRFQSANDTLNGSDINTANLRAMFANEKLWSITGATRKSYDAQTLAHFGFHVPTDIKHQVQHIGHDVTPIHIGEVISTSGTDSQPLGTIAGKGYAENNHGKTFKFTAPCHGVLMAISSAMVKQTYIAGFDKINAVATWQDFYQPEFDHLGMQPLFGYEVKANAANAANVLGWQYRYEQYKRKYNRASYAFGDGYFSTWMNVQRPYRNVKNVAANIPTDRLCFYASPWQLNGIMVNSYSTAWSDDFLTTPYAIYEDDPLVHHAFINYKKLSTMSTYSMPRLDA